VVPPGALLLPPVSLPPGVTQVVLAPVVIPPGITQVLVPVVLPPGVVPTIVTQVAAPLAPATGNTAVRPSQNAGWWLGTAAALGIAAAGGALFASRRRHR
jgi:hypothetical protein